MLQDKGRGRSKPRRFSCQECPLWFNHRQSLWRHIRNIHQSKSTLFCSRCSYQAGQVGTLFRHMETCHPSEAGEGAKSPAQSLGQDRSLFSAVRTVVTGSQPTTKAMSPSESSPSPKVAEATASKQSVGAAVLSLSPTPMSPLTERPSSPQSKTVSPYVRSGGKPKGMLQMVVEEAAESLSSASQEDEQEAASLPFVPPPAKKTRTATVREYTCTQVYLDGKLVKTDEHNSVYQKQIEVDAEGKPTGK